MEQFEKNKKEYLDYIKSDDSLLLRLINDNSKTEEGKKSLRLILDPRDEKELSVARTLYMMVADFTYLLDGIISGEVSEIPYEENEGIKYYIDVINKLKNGIDINEMNDKDISISKAAKTMYDFLVTFVSNPEETNEYIANETGFDLNDYLDYERYNIYFEIAKDIMNSNNKTNKPFEECTEKDIEDGRRFALEFHNICEKEKLDKSKRLSR